MMYRRSTLIKSTFAAVFCLVATAIGAQAQAFYPTYPGSPGYPNTPWAAPNTPLSWSYDPYASGFGPCPQRHPGDAPCSVTLKPTFGQPSYYPVQ
jgi:hypothetical protein